MSPGAWRTGAAHGVEEWQRHLARVDRAFGNVVERQARDVGLLLANGPAWETYDDSGALVGVALAIPDEECLVRVAAEHPARPTLMESGIRLVEEYLRRGVPLWVPSNDVAAQHVAESHGIALSYRDQQMRIDTATARRTSPLARVPGSFRELCARAVPLGPAREPAQRAPGGKLRRDPRPGRRELRSRPTPRRDTECSPSWAGGVGPERARGTVRRGGSAAGPAGRPRRQRVRCASPVLRPRVACRLVPGQVDPGPGVIRLGARPSVPRRP